MSAALAYEIRMSLTNLAVSLNGKLDASPTPKLDPDPDPAEHSCFSNLQLKITSNLPCICHACEDCVLQ